MYFSSASKELRALLTPAARQQLRTDYEAATALCHKTEMRSCNQLREAKVVVFVQKVLSSDDLALLGTLGSVLPALEELRVCEPAAGRSLRTLSARLASLQSRRAIAGRSRPARKRVS